MFRSSWKPGSNQSSVAQEGLDLPMLVRQLLKTVVVAVQTLLRHAHHQDPPKVHPRAARVPAAVRKDARVQQPEQLLPRRLVVPDRLEPDKDRRDVVPGFHVQLDRSDVDRAQPGPLLNNLPHANRLRRFQEKRRYRGEFGRIMPNRGNLRKQKHGLKTEIQRVAGFLPNTIVLDCVKSRLNGDNAARARMWRDKLGVWLQNYWPKAGGRNTPKTSSAMLEMIAKCGDAFEDAAVWSLDFLQPVANPYLYPLNKSNLAKRHPELVLSILNKIVKAGIILDYKKGELREILIIILDAKDSLSDDTRFKRLYKISVD